MIATQHEPGRRGATYLAVEEILAKTYTSSADTAVIAVVNILERVIIPELANVAVIARRRHSAVDADVRCALGAGAQHAQHVLGGLPDEGVVLGRIVTEPARVPFVAGRALRLHVSPVVLAAQDSRGCLPVDDCVGWLHIIGGEDELFV